MSKHNFGIVGVANVTLTMFTDRDHDAKLAKEAEGKINPGQWSNKVVTAQIKKRLRLDGAENLSIFPV